jgi:hypothetical protein
LWAKWQTAPNSLAFSNWTDMGGILTSNPDAYRDSSGKIEIFARGQNWAVYTLWQPTPCTSWSAWTSLGGTITSYPYIGAYGDSNFVSIGGCGTNGYTYLKSRNNGVWSSWSNSGSRC